MEHLESEPTWTDGTYVIGEISYNIQFLYCLIFSNPSNIKYV